MIGFVNNAARTAYATTRLRNADNTTRASDTMANPAATQVDISPAGKLIADLPRLVIDPNEHLANARKRLDELMDQMGIPPGTAIDFDIASNGRITVTGDSENLSALEDSLNDGTEMALRNSLIGAQSGAVLQRVVAASQKAQQQIEANPQATQTLWNRLLSEVDRISGQSVDFKFSGGTFSRTFSDGTDAVVA